MKLIFITIKNNGKKNTGGCAGFTLIETLVAITILMISIVGPMTIASKGLVAAVGSRDQVIASYLAQDAMESIKNLRDNQLLANASTGFGWGYFMAALASPGCLSPSDGSRFSLCGIETAPSGAGGSLIGCSTISACNIYMDRTYGYYTYTSSNNTPTLFNRTFSVTKEDKNGVADAALVIVTVTWKEGGVVNSVVLKDMIFNTTR